MLTEENHYQITWHSNNMLSHKNIGMLFPDDSTQWQNLLQYLDVYT